MRQLLSKKIPMPYKPTIKFPGDTSNFNQYPDSDNLPPPIKPAEDPFGDWWTELQNKNDLMFYSKPIIQTFIFNQSTHSEYHIDGYYFIVSPLPY